MPGRPHDEPAVESGLLAFVSASSVPDSRTEQRPGWAIFNSQPNHLSSPVPSRFRLFILLLRSRYGPDVRARVQQAIQARDPGPGSSDAIAAVTAIRMAMRRTARWVPRSRCLDQALATWIVAREFDLPARFRLGVKRVNGKTTAHAWIQVGSVDIDEDAAGLRQLLPLLPGGLPEVSVFD